MEVLLPERLRGHHVGGRGLDRAGRRRDGTGFRVEISLSYVRTAVGVRVMTFVADITERVLLERSARTPRSWPRSARCRPGSRTS